MGRHWGSKFCIWIVLFAPGLQAFSAEMPQPDYLTRLSYAQGYDLENGTNSSYEWELLSATLLLNRVETAGIMASAAEKIKRISSIDLRRDKKSSYRFDWQRQDMTFVFRHSGYPLLGAISHNKTNYSGEIGYLGQGHIEEKVTELKLGWYAWQNTSLSVGYQELEYDLSAYDARGAAIEIDAVYPDVASGAQWRLYVNQVRPKQKGIYYYKWFYVWELDAKLHANEILHIGAGLHKGNKDIYKSKYTNVNLHLGLRLFSRWKLETHYNLYTTMYDRRSHEFRIQTGFLF